MNFDISDYDGDGNDEYLILTSTALILSRVSPLTVPIVGRPILNPSEISLLPPYPNPFNSSTTIEYSLPRPGRYVFSVVDITGREVARLSDGWKDAGSYREVWNGRGLGSGTYWVRMETNTGTQTRAMSLIR